MGIGVNFDTKRKDKEGNVNAKATQEQARSRYLQSYLIVSSLSILELH
jgi:hypothetical protein